MFCYLWANRDPFLVFLRQESVKLFKECFVELGIVAFVVLIVLDIARGRGARSLRASDDPWLVICGICTTAVSRSVFASGARAVITREGLYAIRCD